MTWSFNEHFWLKETRHSSLWYWSRNLIKHFLQLETPAFCERTILGVIMAVYWGWFIMKHKHILPFRILPLCSFHDAKEIFTVHYSETLLAYSVVFVFNVGAQQWIRGNVGVGKEVTHWLLKNEVQYKQPLNILTITKAKILGSFSTSNFWWENIFPLQHILVLTWFWEYYGILWASQVVLVTKNPPGDAGDVRDAGSIPGLGRCPGEGHGNPLQYSCLENLMDRGAWWAIVHRVAESDTTEAT